MPIDLEKLTKVLKLEASGGYLDKIVISGLEAFIENWVTSSLKEKRIPDESGFIELVSERLKTYGDLEPIKRAQAIQGILAKAAELGGTSAPKLVTEIQTTPSVLPHSLSSQSTVSSRSRNSFQSMEKPDLDAPLTTLKGVGEAYYRLLEFINLKLKQSVICLTHTF